MLKKLFSPKKINQCEIPNRLAVTAMVANFCNEDGTATDRYIAYHETKAKGGWGLIITEDYAINEHAMGYRNIAGLWNDGQIESHKKLTDTIHQYDSKIFCQIYHAGRQSCSFVNGGVQPYAPSAIPCPWLRELPRELKADEIKQLVTEFGDCAFRAKKAGFDGVEIHAGHGYLLAEFMSPLVNKRTDQYGGSFDNRIRIVKEVLDDVRRKVGKDFPVIIRFSAEEGYPGSRDLSESRVLAKLFEEWGFDALNVSNGAYGDYNHGGIVAPMYFPHAWAVNNAAEIKRLVNIPVFTVNRINEPRMAETILELDKADFIGMGRGSLADPELPNKAKAGNWGAIRSCIGCLQGCTGSLYKGTALRCLVNPALGKEGVINLDVVDKPKKVMVIGGGPGGLEAAHAAALKGHKVSLYEKREFLGGQFKSAAYPPCKGELATYITWITNQLEKLGVEIHLNTEMTKEQVENLRPDKIIIATGGTPLIPKIKGVEKEYVITAEDVLLGKAATGNQIVIAGGGEVGSETAAHLGMQQRAVTVIEMMPELCRDLDGVNKINLMRLLKEYDVKSYINTKVVEILDDGVVIEEDGNLKTIPADTVILALGYKPYNDLVESLKAVCDDISVIGGAVKTSNAMEAISEGFEVGLGIA